MHLVVAVSALAIVGCGDSPSRDLDPKVFLGPPVGKVLSFQAPDGMEMQLRAVEALEDGTIGIEETILVPNAVAEGEDETISRRYLLSARDGRLVVAEQAKKTTVLQSTSAIGSDAWNVDTEFFGSGRQSKGSVRCHVSSVRDENVLEMSRKVARIECGLDDVDGFKVNAIAEYATGLGLVSRGVEIVDRDGARVEDGVMVLTEIRDAL